MSTGNGDSSGPRSRWQAVLRDYGLTITLGALFLFSWGAQFVFQWQDYQAQEVAHGQVPHLSGFMPAFFSATFENWQSEFLQLLSFVVLTAFLYHRGSHESKDSDEQQAAALLRIERRLESLGARIDVLGSAKERQSFEQLQEEVETSQSLGPRLK
jgi:hypothetical protein